MKSSVLITLSLLAASATALFSRGWIVSEHVQLIIFGVTLLAFSRLLRHRLRRNSETA